jgi:bifunctional non-homologous end joining protein LigD
LAGTRQALKVEGRTLTVSNLEKVMYPAAQFTKAEVIQYYVHAANFLLPHLKQRPVTLKRYPEGIGGAHFYEKDAPAHTPDWVETFPVPRRMGGSDIRYVVINDLPVLVWAANLANLEIHPFLHRVPHIDRPSWMVFDLDPGEGADVLTCAQVALLLRERLEAMKLQSLVKVSGSKGLQVYVPLNGTAGYGVVQPFARRLAQSMAERYPELAISEMAKRLRPGKVFIDWSQNSDFKTTVAVYSLRAKRPQPLVSMPVTWDELDAARKAGKASRLDFTPAAALARLEKRGDLFAPVLKLKQKLPAAERALPAAGGAAARSR